jgi:tRNA pseudouridine38-40 synthase
VVFPSPSVRPPDRAPARTLKLTIQYDGTNYVGWQRQAAGTSIQGLLEDALAPIEGAPVTVHGAGRTDAGVHALAQVASVTLSASLDATTLARALNATLPEDVRIVRADEAAAGFHARFSATGKTYEYRIVAGPFVSPFVFRYAWHVPQSLDLDAMRGAAEPLVGRHDFAAFQAAGSTVHSTEREITSIEWEEGRGADHPLVVRITGDGFLRHMARAMVGTLVEVGCRRWARRRPFEALESGSRAAAGPTAPPRGLFLARVLYDTKLGGGVP